jgi:HAMP domain-containing protein
LSSLSRFFSGPQQPTEGKVSGTVGAPAFVVTRFAKANRLFDAILLRACFVLGIREERTAKEIAACGACDPRPQEPAGLTVRRKIPRTVSNLTSVAECALPLELKCSTVSKAMRLALKFNILFVAMLGLTSAAAYLIGRHYLMTGARDRVSQQARLMMETTSSIRKYTSEHIRPILDKYQHNSAAFYPESVPAFSAGRMFGYLREIYPEYTYREATLNPTNSADRAVDWEADIIRVFRRNPAQRESMGERDAPNGRVLYLARPIKALESCLECHSTPASAPVSMVSLYGSDNGFGWKLNEIIGAQIVSVPVSVSEALGVRSLGRFVAWLAGFALVTLALLNAALYLNVIRPLSRISAVAGELSKGNLNVAEIPAKGRDEISVLGDSLNRINRSLVRAIGLLGR